MSQQIAHITLVVRDYDEAIEFYTTKLGFLLVEDTLLDEGKRWVLVAPPGAKECCLLLAEAANEQQLRCVGNQSGGRVFLFLFTDNFDWDYNKLIENNVNFVRPPAEHNYGRVAVFEDLYGNLWDLLEPSQQRFAKKQ
jgi:catechol 2,3-dioxygenase-like lactoylglutathione lyase family enzyme